VVPGDRDRSAPGGSASPSQGLAVKHPDPPAGEEWIRGRYVETRPRSFFVSPFFEEVEQPLQRELPLHGLRAAVGDRHANSGGHMPDRHASAHLIDVLTQFPRVGGLGFDCMDPIRFWRERSRNHPSHPVFIRVCGRFSSMAEGVGLKPLPRKLLIISDGKIPLVYQCCGEV
jgi:hypothetical protein